MRKKSPSQISKEMKAFLGKNPKIKEALQAFDISYSQYEKALEGGIRFYNAASTQTKNH